MIKKTKFYDIFTIIYFVAMIIAFFIRTKIIFRMAAEKVDMFGSGATYASTGIDLIAVSTFMIIFSFIYWLIILLLAINLHKKELTKTIDLVIIIIITPLAPIFYFTNLRKSLKKYNAQPNQQVQQVKNTLSNVPGTP